MSNQFKNLFFLIAFCAFAVSGFAQELGEGQYEGYILDDKGKKKEGIIELSSINNPWENQRTVWFIDMKTWEKSNGKLKKKDKEKFKAKDIKGYGFDGRVFLTMKYTATASDDGSDVNKFTTGMSTISNLSKNQHFMEQILDGKVKVYRFYSYPPDAAAYQGGEKAKYDEMIANLKNDPSVLIIKGKKGKLKDFEGMLSFKKFIEDCEVVLAKYENNEYMKKKKLKVKSMVTDALSGATQEDKCLEIMQEYNELCGGK